MLNLNYVVSLDSKQKTKIEKLKMESGKLEAEHWKRNETALRIAITRDLKKLQNNRCVYCGCKIDGTPDCEHIAHKSTYPQFIFTPLNLALSCKTCNQTFKHDRDIVEKEDCIYVRCDFRMVHPYLDNVDRYFDTSKFRIRIKERLSKEEVEKAKYTEELLHWADSEVVSKRARQHLADERLAELGMTEEEYIEEMDEKRDRCVSYNPYIV